MAANANRDASQERDGRARRRLGLPALARRIQSARALTVVGHLGRRWDAAPPWLRAATILLCAVAFVSVITYASSRIFSGRAADNRAANEAASFAEHSARIATGEAFDGYIQMLRYADDPTLRSRASTPTAQQEVLRQLIGLNVNKFQALLIADRSGNVLTTTDPAFSSVEGNVAFGLSRGHLGPANSDIILTEAGKTGYVDFTAPLRDTDGTVWGFVIGRADPARIWRETLIASVDGGRNVIINSQGQYAAGVPEPLLRLPWHGELMSDGRVRATVAGVPSICGIAPIGKDTQMDSGLSIASCLPTSIIQAERSQATGKQWLVTLAAAAFAAVAGGVALRWTVGRQSPPAEPAAAAGRETPDVTLDELFQALPEEPAAPPEKPLLPPADVDALALVDAYERRAARLADRLRDDVQAKLLLATTQVDEAFRIAGADADLAASLHEIAIGDLETVRDGDLRSLGHALYPGHVRLGLPAALRALASELGDLIETSLDIDPRADRVGSEATGAALTANVRLLLYRIADDMLRALAFAGAADASLRLERRPAAVVLTVEGDIAATEIIANSDFAAHAITVEAHAGTFTLSVEGDHAMCIVHVPTAPLAELADNAAAPDDAPQLVDPRRVAEPALESLPLPAALEAMQAELFGEMVVGISIDEGLGEVDWDALREADRTALYGRVRAVLRALRDGHTRRCDLIVGPQDGFILLSVRGTLDAPAAPDALQAAMPAGVAAIIEGDAVTVDFETGLRATASGAEAA